LIQRERLRRTASKRAALIDKLLKRPRRLIITILMGNDLVNIGASVVAAYLCVSLFGEQGKWIAMVSMTLLTLIFAEVIPKTFCILHNERVAPLVSGPLTVFAKIIRPLHWIFYKIAVLLIKFLGADKTGRSAGTIMEDEFRDMVDLSHQKGELEGAERELIHNVFDFSDTRVHEVMVPAEKMFSLPENIGASDIVRRVKKIRHSRIPIHRDNTGDIVGILYAKDLLKVETEKLKTQTRLLPGLCRKAYFVPETKKIDELFYFFNQKRTHMAMCINARGKVTGLVTMEDLLEELFGEIYDEYDREAK
jgi:putative hemolysin